MGIEIERKFLVDRLKWKNSGIIEKFFIRQGYISTDPDKTVRVRLVDHTGYLTIKGIVKGNSRPESEYPIPERDAKEL
jgi:adenylate cyclase